MDADFHLDSRLAADCHQLGSLALCELLLMNDAQYPWYILVPRRSGIREIYELAETDQRQLLLESVQLGRAMKAAFGGDKLNVAALGNVVPQLHLHHIVRRIGDSAWPAPVWGRSPPQPYSVEGLRQALEHLLPQLPAAFEAGYAPPAGQATA